MQDLIAQKFHLLNWETVATAPFPYTTQEYYLLKVENQGPNIRASINGNKVLEVSDAKYPAGKIGLSANVPARFQDVLVEVSHGGEAGYSEAHL